MKHLIILLFLGFLVTSYCTAQSPEELTGLRPAAAVRNRAPVRAVGMITVTFITNDTCNLKIGDADYGEFVNNKTIKLPLGNYRLSFESLETGETINKRSFRLTRDSITGGKYTYQVTFK
jgi:hypothetical protein